MKTKIAFGLFCAMITFNVGANTNVDVKPPQIDPQTLENAFNDDTIGINYIDESGMVIIHDETPHDDSIEKIVIDELIKKSEQIDEIIAEKDSEKLTRTIISIIILLFVMMSIRNRKKSK